MLASLLLDQAETSIQIKSSWLRFQTIVSMKLLKAELESHFHPVTANLLVQSLMIVQSEVSVLLIYLLI